MVLDWSPLTYPDLQLFSPSSPVLLPSTDLPAPGSSEAVRITPEYEETRVATNPDIYNDIQYRTNYHYNEGGHRQSLIGEVTPSKIENNIVSLSTDQDADGENKRADSRDVLMLKYFSNFQMLA